MKLSLLVLALAIAVAICEAKKCKVYSSDEIDTEFEKVTKKNGKDFKKVEEKTKKKKNKDDRKKLFQRKMKDINQHNKKSSSFCQGPNKFTAMDQEEFEIGFLGYKPGNDPGSIPTKQMIEMKRETLPTQVDHAALTGPVENQGGCGSCWAFSASHSVTGTMAALKGHAPIQYSEEQIVDCSLPEGQDGCQGADAYYGYDYLKTHEFKTDAEYAYEGKDSECTAKNVGTNFLLKGWARTHDFGTVNVEAIKQQLAKQPMAVAMQVVSDFQSYTSGIYDHPNCAEGNALNHDMVIVGYGVDNGTPYWKIKNSWGANYGEGGFIRVKMGSNVCNVEIDTRYPIPADSSTPSDVTAAPTPAPSSECVDEAKQCAHYGSEACKNDTYRGGKNTTKTGVPCVEGISCYWTEPECRNTDHDQAPWCFTDVSQGIYDYCFPPC